jgi:hypothetical protein
LNIILLRDFFSFVISFLYLIPAIILLLLGVGTLAFSFISAYLGETTWYDLGSLGADESEAVTALASQDFSLIMPMILKMAPVIILGVLLAILATYVLPIAILDYIKTGKLKAAFNWKAVFRRAFTGKYFIVWIVVSLIGIVAAMLLRIIPILGKAAASFITGVIGYTLFGEVYKKLK